MRLVQQPRQDCRLVAFADPATLQAAAAALDLPLRLLPPEALPERPGDLPIQALLPRSSDAFWSPRPCQCSCGDRFRALRGGKPLRTRECRMASSPARHTRPLSIRSGIHYTGTTELLAAAGRARDVVTMLANPHLRVALVTTHLPLRDVPDAITAALLERCLRIVNTAMCGDFGIATLALPSLD